MDGQQYSQMVERLNVKGITDYTDGDIAAEYALYVKEQEALKIEQAIVPTLPIIEPKTIAELKSALKTEADKKKAKKAGFFVQKFPVNEPDGNADL